MDFYIYHIVAKIPLGIIRYKHETLYGIYLMEPPAIFGIFILILLILIFKYALQSCNKQNYQRIAAAEAAAAAAAIESPPKYESVLELNPPEYDH